MNTSQKRTTKKVPIYNDLDIIVARLRAREVARELGFGTIDQARISLAAGELARALAENMDIYGEITISGIQTAEHIGIQVVGNHLKVTGTDGTAVNTADAHHTWSPQNISKLVDECHVENNQEQGSRITLMKWL